MLRRPTNFSDENHLILIPIKRTKVRGAPRGYAGKVPWAHGGCLGTGRRRRTWQAAISRGEAQTAPDPRISEWGNPPGRAPGHGAPNQIGAAEATGGTETSKYPEERKSTEIPGVAASETGPAQTPARSRARGRCCRRCCGIARTGGPRSPRRGHKGHA